MFPGERDVKLAYGYTLAVCWTGEIRVAFKIPIGQVAPGADHGVITSDPIVDLSATTVKKAVAQCAERARKVLR